MSAERSGRGPWARLFASAVVRDEGSGAAELGRTLLREGEVQALEVEVGAIRANVAGFDVALTAEPVPARIWAAMTRFARGNAPLEAAVEGRQQSVHLEHLMVEDWDEPLVPRPAAIGRECSAAGHRGRLCEHVAALAFAVADEIDEDPTFLLRWRGCVAAEQIEPADAEEPEEPDEDVVVTASGGDPWLAGPVPPPPPLRPLPVGAVLKRLGPSGLDAGGQDLARALERAYASFAASGGRTPRD
jgi:uncharacterized Zn finger protein